MRDVQEISGQTEAAYGTRRAAYDLKKLRGKNLIAKVGSSRRYEARPQGIRTIAALLILRDQVIKPLLAGVATRKPGRKSKNCSSIMSIFKPFALTCKIYSSICASQHRQFFVDPEALSA